MKLNFARICQSTDWKEDKNQGIIAQETTLGYWSVKFQNSLEYSILQTSPPSFRFFEPSKYSLSLSFCCKFQTIHLKLRKSWIFLNDIRRNHWILTRCTLIAGLSKFIQRVSINRSPILMFPSHVSPVFLQVSSFKLTIFNPFLKCPKIYLRSLCR